MSNNYNLKKLLSTQFADLKQQNAKDLLKQFFKECFDQFSNVEIIKWTQLKNDIFNNSEGEVDANFEFDFLILIKKQKKFKDCNYDYNDLHYKLFDLFPSQRVLSEESENYFIQLFFEAFGITEWHQPIYFCVNRQLEFSTCE